MNRRPIPPAVAIALSAVIIALTVNLWLSTNSTDSEQTSRSSKTPPPSPHETSPQQADASLPEEFPSDANEQLPEAAIPNERVLTFASDSDYRAFLDTLPPGVRLLAQNDRLLSVRVQVPSSFDSSALPDSAQSDFNYTLLTPQPILTDTLAADKSFGDSALSFINGLNANPTAGKGIKVAVLDTGIRSHTTLDPHNLQQLGFSDPQSYLSHGTAVASLIAGQEGIGIAPQAELLGIQVLDTDGIGDAFSLSEAIVQAVDAGANIINMSLGSYGSNQALANAVAYAESQGVVLVASAGNESVAALPYPAAYESVIAVSAIDADGHPTSFANQSAAVDIAAPGVGVYAAWEDEKWISFTGTSASAPYVSGAIAALSSTLEIPATEAAAILLANANDSGLPGPDSQLGRGYIDLQRSYNSATSYTDLALADIYLVPPAGEGDPYSVHLTAQNRGTEALPAANLQYTLPNGITQNIYLGALEPGESASHTLAVDPTALELGYEITAQAETRSFKKDTNPENDTKSVRLTLPKNESP
ncbi:S8 family serine peptidase [Pelagicoccus sp. SDUM812005]|uniref:S8 family peptidase n=1 Tax=Pelagicoccus sp. SDUM812005 TaxID=3041257 RepID=UPI002810315A|nr:S8 family serine peptidase [Pelagicoccus sp. SDUM812005]MDQ8181260.1 S8 family serine peptidase [Pelagicoccus sp. SDUM812005]